jgi:catechol 2,3-dioxygenase-like lactoylglutathione lyase family enzyme
MLNEARVAARLPTQDLERARRFYSEKLGLEPRDERDGGLLYSGSSGEFALFASQGSSSGTFTQLAFEIDDIEATVAELKQRGVVFDEVDIPGLETIDGITEITGQYPSKGRAERAAWFRDSEGNVIGVSEIVGSSDME